MIPRTASSDSPTNNASLKPHRPESDNNLGHPAELAVGVAQAVNDGTAARAARTDGNLLQTCQSVAKQIVPDWPPDVVSYTQVQDMIQWGDGVRAVLEATTLVPQRDDSTIEVAYDRALDKMSGVCEATEPPRCVTRDRFATSLSRVFIIDPGDKTFVDAAEELGLDYHITSNKRVRVLMSDTSKREVEKRHVVPATDGLVEPQLWADPQTAAELTDKVALLYGPSGSGKTTAAIMIGHQRDAVHVYVTSESINGGQDIAEGLDLEPRNREVVNLIMSRLKELVPRTFRHTPQGQKATRPLVLVLDEFAKLPVFVRGVVSARLTIVQEVRKCLMNGSVTNPVYIVVAGTGVEGASHKPGTMPDQYTLRRVRPQLWEEAKKALPAPTRELVDSGRHPETQLARQLVRNARACALFVQSLTSGWLYTAMQTADVRLLRAAAVQAAFEFKRLNGLVRLSKAAHCALMLDAVALQAVDNATMSGAVPPVDLTRQERCVREFGVSADRAIICSSTDVASDSEVLGKCGAKMILALPKEFEGVRFEVDPAQLAMVLLMQGLGDRGTSAESFEESTMDFLVWAMHSSQESFFPTGGEYFRRTLDTENTPSRAWRYRTQRETEADELKSTALTRHQRWRYPLEVVAVLKKLRETANVTDEPLDVAFYQSTKWILSHDNLRDQVQTHWHSKTVAPELPAQHVAHVVINFDKAPAQDVSVMIKHAVLHVQCKRFVKEKITDRAVFAELHKMGHSDWRCELARWLSQPAKERTTAKMSADFPSLNGIVSNANVMVDYTGPRVPEFPIAVERLQPHAPAIHDDPDLVGSATQYAIIVHGVRQRPLAVELPRDATVYASVDVTGANTGPSEAAMASSRLRGMYPLDVGLPTALAGVSRSPVRHPVPDPGRGSPGGSHALTQHSGSLFAAEGPP